MSLDKLTREGAEVVSRCEVWVEGKLVDEPPIINGSVHYDITSRVLRSCEVDLIGDIPVLPTDPLAPIGSVLRLFRGARDWTGEVFEEPLGRYAFDSASITRSEGIIRIGGYGFSQLVSDARWEEPYLILSGTNFTTAISEAVQSRLPTNLWENPDLVSLSRAVPMTVWGEEVDNDPWEDIKGLAASSGMDVLFGRDGRFTLSPIPDPDTVEATWDFTAGKTPNYLDGSRELKGRPYNVVVVKGETADNTPPVRAVAEDDNPKSASFVGRYRRPYFLTSSFIETQEQADEAAQGQLNRLIGLAEVVTMRVIPHPRLDVRQVLTALDPELKIDSRYIIDKVTLPLGPGQAALVTRRRRI